MKILQKTLTSMLIFSALSTADTFEQNGVKEGNNRISINLTSALHNDSGADASGYVYGQYGKFLTNDIEVFFDTFLSKGTLKGTDGIDKSSVTYMLGAGANYYFLKSPTLTPYVGTQIFYSDAITDAKGEFDIKGSKHYLAAHKFLNENTSITVETGIRIYDFKDYKQTYWDIYLSYFFD